MSEWNPGPRNARDLSKFDNQRDAAFREARLLRAAGDEEGAKKADEKAAQATANYNRIYIEMSSTPLPTQSSRDRPNAGPDNWIGGVSSWQGRGGGSKRRRKKRKYTKKRKSSRKRRSRARTRRRRR
jgi:hypothetical protein